jgi:hypothetical protein
MHADPIGRPLVCVQLAQWHASRQAIHHTAGAPFPRTRAQRGLGIAHRAW